MFNLMPQSSACLILGSEIELESFPIILSMINTEEAHWPRMMALCLYAQFVLVSASGNCDAKILHILNQVKAGCNPFPLILAETLIGLDDFASTRHFSGSPILLEVSFLLRPLH